MKTEFFEIFETLNFLQILNFAKYLFLLILEF
jgi:hypothetical protein